MKILLIDVNCKYSSTGKIVYSLYQHLKQSGHTVAVCYGRGEKINESGIYKFGLDWETHIHAGLARLTGKNGYYSPFSTNRLINYIEEFKPDVIHVHELHAYFVNIYQLLEHINKKKIKVVWTFHCEYMYTGRCGVTQGCDKWLNGCGKCPNIKEYPKSMFFDFSKEMFLDKKNALEDFDFTIVTPSQWLANRVKKTFLSKHKVIVIPNGIDTEKVFYPRKEKPMLFNMVKPNKKIILSVAPNILSEQKGGKYILELSEKMKDLDYEFVLIGTDETKRYSENILFIQKTKNQDELAKWYSLADIFLICSTMENFPTTCLESLSCGTPIIGFDCGGTAEIAPIPYGNFVSLGDTKGLQDLTLKIDTSNEFHKNIRNFAVENYDTSIMSKRYEELYKSL